MTVKWETIIGGGGFLERAEVPGGWIYKSVGEGICFVPDPLIYMPVPQVPVHVPSPRYGPLKQQAVGVVNTIDADFTIVEETPTEGTA